jgi:hypothetical protein
VAEWEEDGTTGFAGGYGVGIVGRAEIGLTRIFGPEQLGVTIY